MSVSKIAARWLFVLCLPVLLITASIAICVNLPALYTRGFNRYHITQVTGLDMSQLQKAAAGLRDYFNNGQKYIDIVVTKDGQPFTLFKPIEVDHLKDVKALFRLDYKGAAATLIYVVLFTLAALFWWRDRRQLWKGMRDGAILTLVLMIALGITIAVDFNGFFIEFHILSFSNSFWELNPLTDYLVMMFPEQFWSDATTFIAAGAAGAALIIGGIGWWQTRRAAASDD